MSLRVIIGALAALVAVVVAGVVFAQRDTVSVMDMLEAEPDLARLFADHPDRRASVERVLGQGSTEQQFINARNHIQLISIETNPYYMQRARGEDLLEYYRAYLDVAKQLQFIDTERCVAFYFGRPMPGRAAVLDVRNPELVPLEEQMREAIAAMIESAAADPLPTNGAAASATQLQASNAMAERLSEYQLGLVAQTLPIQSDDDEASYCRGVSVFFEEVFRLPEEDAINMFRHFAGQ